MGKGKLAKFSEMETFTNVFQYPFAVLQEKGFDLQGHWNERYFHNNHPIVLELGCGKGEYTVGMAKLFPDKNFIGVDIKGARMWTGAKQAFKDKMENVAFLRTDIELIDHFFAPCEVSEIWLTFPDPQMKNINKRLTSIRFIKLYQHFLNPEGIIHLKTDSDFMYKYTCSMVEVNHFPIQFNLSDLYASPSDDFLFSIKTYYEKQWLARGMKIKYLRFVCERRNLLIESNKAIEPDSYRSFGRNRRSQLNSK